MPEFQAQQAKKPVLNGRPAHNYGPPVGLFHPVFNSFHADMRNQGPPDSSTYPSIRALFAAFAEIYATESDRITAFSQHLYDLIGGAFRIIEAAGVKSDGVLTAASCGRSAVVSLLEVKNEIGAGHSDPYNQGSLAYRKYWAQRDGKLLSIFIFISANSHLFQLILSEPAAIALALLSRLRVPGCASSEVFTLKEPSCNV
jgi:hypothetical protein